MSGRRSFVYQPRTVEDVHQRAQEIGSDSPGVIMDQFKRFSARKGDNCIRILPATWEGARHWGFDVYWHTNVGPDRATVMCNNKMGQGRCYGCEMRTQAERAGDEEAAKELRPKRRAACWLIDRNAEENGPQLWTMPGQLDEDIQGVSIDKTDGKLYLVDDPYNGYDVTFTVTGQQKLTRYNNANLSRHASSVHPGFLDFVVANPVPNCLVWRTYEEVKAMYEGGMGEGADLPPTTPAYAPPPSRGYGRPAPAPRGGATAAPPPRGYPPSGPVPDARPAPIPRRAFGPPATTPPVDQYRGEQYAVDPNYPPPSSTLWATAPPASNGNGYVTNDPNGWRDPNNPNMPADTAQYLQDEIPPWIDNPNYAPPQQQYEEPPAQWNADPRAVNYTNPPQGYVAPPQPPPSYQMPPRGPQRRPLPPSGGPAGEPQYVQPQYTPRPASNAPQAAPPYGRGAAPPQQRSSTSATETAARLRQSFER